MVKTMIAVINKITDLLGYAAGVLICVLACLLIYEVLMRYVLNNPIYWTLDITTLLQIPIAFMAAAYVLKIGGHVNMAALVVYVGLVWKRRLAIVTNVITGLTAGWMCVLSWKLFTQSMAISEKTFGMDMPLAPWKFFVPLGFGVLCLQALAIALDLWLDDSDSVQKYKGGH